MLNTKNGLSEHLFGKTAYSILLNILMGICLYRGIWKLVLLVCLIGLPYNALYAQKTTHEDSLIRAVQVAKNDTQKVDAQLKLLAVFTGRM